MKRIISFSIIAYILGVSVFFFLAAGVKAAETTDAVRVVRESDGNFTVEEIQYTEYKSSVVYRIIDREFNIVCYTKSSERSGISCINPSSHQARDVSRFDRTTRHKVISE
jgi:hypothetical protein